MASRLEQQKRPGRVHVRFSKRYYKRGYDTNPHEPWGDTYNFGVAVTATTAYAGFPGDFGPQGATQPANAAAIATLTARPLTAWTTGQYSQSAVSGLTGRAYWNGTAWVTGAIAP